jgi:hypothetical protein
MYETHPMLAMSAAPCSYLAPDISFCSYLAVLQRFKSKRESILHPAVCLKYGPLFTPPLILLLLLQVHLTPLLLSNKHLLLLPQLLLLLLRPVFLLVFQLFQLLLMQVRHARPHGTCRPLKYDTFMHLQLQLTLVPA